MVHQLFATQVYQAQTLSKNTGLFRSLAKEAQLIMQSDQEGQTWSKKNYAFGYTSYGSLNALHRVSPHFYELSILIDQQMAKFVKALNFDLSPKQLKLKNLWLNWMEQGSHHSWHLHPHQVISGSFYLAIPSGATGIKFQDPRMHAFMNRPLIKPTAKGQQNFFELKVRPGEVLLFESWLLHEVPTQIQKSPRVSVSFNYDWA